MRRIIALMTLLSMQVSLLGALALAQPRPQRKPHCPPKSKMIIITCNIAQYVGNGRWDWALYIKTEPPTFENDIVGVEYTLHPTFEPRVRRGDPANKYAIYTNGWGTFRVGVVVNLRPESELFSAYGKLELITLDHQLSFSPQTWDGMPVEIDQDPPTSDAQGTFTGRIFLRSTGEFQLNEIRCAKYVVYGSPDIFEVCKPGRFEVDVSGTPPITIAASVYTNDGLLREFLYIIR